MKTIENLATAVVLLISVVCPPLFAQSEFSNWYFGQSAGINFGTSPPTALTNANLSFAVSEGCATISDANGNILFYTNGGTVYDATHAVMANGTGLYGGGSSSQGVIIVKQPGQGSLYYLFTTPDVGTSNGLCYSIVDMTLAAGLGSVTAKNVSLHSPSCEKLLSVKHCNGKDAWILSHDYNSNQFRAYLLTATGLSSTATLSSVGDTYTASINSTIGYMKISPDGRKLAVATLSNSLPNSMGMGGFSLFDFDPATGMVSNSLVLNNQIGAYGVEFSSDGSKLFGLTSLSSTSSILFQWDLCASSPNAIVSSAYSMAVSNGGGALQRGIDNKIYISFYIQHSLSVIEYPVLYGSAMGFSLNAIDLSGKLTAIGLPNFINPYVRPVVQPITTSVSCSQVQFSPPPVMGTTLGCSIAQYPASGYAWDFGEPSSGAANSSTLQSPSHNYAAPGSYTVKLIQYNPCSNDTLYKTVTITTPGPQPAVSGPTTICKGDRYVYTASGGSAYKWSNNVSTSTVALAPTQNTVYTVSVTLNGCTQKATYSITVEKCAGIEESNAAELNIHPNPFSDVLNIEVNEPGVLEVRDAAGRVVIRSELSEMKTSLNTASIDPGLYFLYYSSKNGIVRMKMMK